MWHHPQVALAHHGGNGIGGKMLELDAIMVAKDPHKAARGRPEPVAMELGERDDIALRRARLPVLCRRRDPLRPRRGSMGAQEPLLLHVPQPALRHG